MNIGLYLPKILTETHAEGIWGDEIWANALVKGFRANGHEANTFGENLGYMPKREIAINFFYPKARYGTKRNIFIHQNFSEDDAINEARIKKTLELKSEGYTIMTISKYYSDKYGWRFLAPCVDTDIFKPADTTQRTTSNNLPAQPETSADLLYIGNNIKNPAKTQEYLSRQYYSSKGVNLLLLGRGFTKEGSSRVSHTQAIGLYSSSKFNFNYGFNIKLNILTARVFQILACKGNVITESIPVLKDVFGDTILYADSKEEVCNHIKNYDNNKLEVYNNTLMAYEKVLSEYNPTIQSNNLLESIVE